MTTPADKPAAPRAIVVRCPHCGNPTPYSADNPWRPFCSERCKSLDLGAWASESYRIAAAPDASDLDAQADRPPNPDATRH